MAVTKSQLIPQAYLRDVFEYRDGALYWKPDPIQRKQWNKNLAGKRAGWRNPKTGYTRITFSATERNGLEKSRSIDAHRLIFCFHHGYYPPQVDHIDGDETNDRIENLRAAESFQNCANRMPQRTNTTGVPGVRLHRDGHYEARVQFAGKRHNVGFFKTLEEARVAIVAASISIRGEWHRGEVSHY